ncbi:MAG: hypothetical protein WKF77_23820, partial [Planctomycetaceae bacterium]
MPILLFAFALSWSAAFGQVEGPIIGKAVRSDVSKPLRELAEEAKRQEREQELADETDQAIGAFLEKKHPGSLTNDRLTPLEDDVLAKVFPKTTFRLLQFRQWPVAFEAPAGLQPSNVCAVVGEHVIVITGVKNLEWFFQKHLLSAKDDEQQHLAVAAWLLLSEALHQDGF